MRPDLHRPMARPVIALAAVAVLTLAASACSSEPQSTEAYCRQAKKVPVLSTVVSNYTDADPQELQSRLQSARDAYAKLGDVATDDIKGEVNDMVDLVDVVIDAVAEHPNDPTAVADTVSQAAKQSRKAVGATRKVYEYTSRTCHLQLDPGDEETTPPPSSTPSSTTEAGKTTTTKP